MPFTPSYLNLLDSGELKRRVEILLEKLHSCDICPFNCKVDRYERPGLKCNSGRYATVSSTFLHFGEEPVLVGRGGSGTVFFTNCNLRCVYCQNWQISQPISADAGREYTPEELANAFLYLQQKGAHNINLVSPTHYVPQIVEAIYLAAKKGLKIPIVYNTNAYDSVETLKLLDGIVDIYLPDFKYWDAKMAVRYSRAPRYPEHAKKAIKEMHRQVGDLIVEDGIALRGLIIRHLVLPNNIAGSLEILKWIREELGPNVHISLMAQYYPANKAYKYPELNRPITLKEYEPVVDMLIDLGLTKGWQQEIVSHRIYRPDFNKEAPFNNEELEL